MCASRRRTKWILGNVQNNYRNMTDYVNRQVDSSTPSDQQQRRPDGQKFDDDVVQKEGGGWLSQDAVDFQCLRMKGWGLVPSPPLGSPALSNFSPTRGFNFAY